MSWHNFIFGVFDPAGTITLDKLPGAFWIQALSVRAFGFHSWAIVLPQAIKGILTVLVLYRAVTRLAGTAAGLVAALVVAVSPAAVALDRGNISDSLMILVLAADAVSAAIVPGGGTTGRLILAGVWVGLAFQAKMIQAWKVLPALGLAYLTCGPGPAVRRLVQLAVAGLVTAVVSISWMTAVSLVPAADRPYFDGSHDNSVFKQVFAYNGFTRFGDQTPLQLLAGQLKPGADRAWTQESMFGAAPQLGPIESMTYAAACTQRMRLGCVVFISTLHSPVHLAKSVSTLDQLSRGRIEVGVGTGGKGRPFAAFGVDRPVTWRGSPRESR